VHAGIVFDARATAESAVPAYATGNVAGVLRITDGARIAWVTALHRVGSATHARIVLGDTTLEGVPLRMGQMRVEGDVPTLSSGSWTDGPRSVRQGATRLCAVPGRRCVVLRNTQPFPVQTQTHAGAWVRVRAVSPEVTLEGWVARSAVTQEPASALGWGAGGAGAVSDGCPYEGRPGLVAAQTPVHVRPDGAVWAHLPDDPDSVWVHDTAPGTPWVEVTFARGVQRSFPGTTCSTGWVSRARVTWEVLREGALRLAQEPGGARVAVVVQAVPVWLRDAGIAVGDVILGRVERGQAIAPYDLDNLRRDLGVGGRFRVARGGRVMEVEVALAPGCRAPGMGQPAACTPR